MTFICNGIIRSFYQSRKLIGLFTVLGLITLCTYSAPTLAESNSQPSTPQSATFPNKPVRWIVPTGAGGGTDLAARLFAQIATESWHQSVVVDNKPGASGMIGLDSLANSPADGYTLGFISVSQFIDSILLQKYSFDSSKDFTPISLVATSPMVLLTHPDSGFSSVKELIEYAKAHPSELSYSSGGSGGLTHLCMEVFLRKAKISAVHIPYKGTGPAIIDLLAGRVQMTFSTLPAAMQYIKTGRLKAIGIASNVRSPLALDIKTFKEQEVNGVVFGNWYGLIGPKNMPPSVVQKISSSLNTSAKVIENKKKIATDGIESVGNSSAQFVNFLEFERNQWISISKDVDFKKQD